MSKLYVKVLLDVEKHGVKVVPLTGDVLSEGLEA